MKNRRTARLLLPVVVLSIVPVAQGVAGGLQPFRATIRAGEVLIPTDRPGVSVVPKFAGRSWE